MKFFHLSDLHIGLKLMQRDLYDEQAHILAQVTELARCEQPDAVVIAGDIYDKAIPAGEAVELFDKFIVSLSDAVPQAEIMLISGNHDSPQRVNVFRSILQRQHIYMVGLPPRTPEEHIEKVTLTDEYGAVNFYLLPFVRPSMVRAVVAIEDEEGGLSYDETLHRLLARENIDEAERNVLVSHQFYLPPGTKADAVERMDSEIRTVGNIDEVRADVLYKFDYAALGHIHKPMQVGRENYRYSGTPLACSVSEAGQDKGVVVVEMREKGVTGIRVLPLVPHHAVRIVKGSLSEVLAQESEDFVTVILTDKDDLDVIDMQDRLRRAFPNLLEIRRVVPEMTYSGTNSTTTVAINADPLTWCADFLGELDGEDEAILQDVINSVKEAD